MMGTLSPETFHHRHHYRRHHHHHHHHHHHWLDSPWWALAFLRSCTHSSLLRATFFHAMS
jgi:hypothetical protein